MNVKHENLSDGCARLLYASLVDSKNLSYHEKKHLRQAFNWHQGERSKPPSLVECMTVLRVVGERFLIRLDDGLSFKYLRFDAVRNRVVLIDPGEEARVPLEETEIGEFFNDCIVSFVEPDGMVEKSFSKITVVENNEYGERIVIGEYTNTLTQYEASGDEVVYHPKQTIDLPESMTSDEVDQWLNNQTVTDVKQLLERNTNG